ncbi:ABC transporter permease [Acidimicrobiia bacterium EGI L10123]|uniref:ABC transporter permease n=1 Tax=Salinilacustrithrix flava TaxID=2957203 RepID=UPI003D7C2E45|nr:ABC transporter permease [Acidimicrobiia bacterium EGI L10123]
MTAVLDRVPGAGGLGGLSKKAKATLAVAGLVLGYALLYVLPGTGDLLRDKAPYGVLFIGTVQGTTTALLAMGLILIYRTNRFVNFSYAAMGALPGAFALGLHLEQGLPFFAALALAVVIGVGVGFVTELLIRRFKGASRLILTVASIGLAQIFGVLSLLANKAIGFISLAGGFTIPLDVRFTLDVKTMTGDEILIIAVVPAVIAGLAWFLLKTDAGVAIRAAAENEDRALLLGIPVYKLGRIVWMIAGGLAALTYVLQAPSSGVSPSVVSAGPAVLLPALAAAVVARLESLPMAFAAGIGLGILDQLVRWNGTGSPSITTMFFLAVILIALLLQRASLSRAMNSESAAFSSEGVIKPVPLELRHLPEIRIAKVVMTLGVLALLVFVPLSWGPSNQLLAAIAMVWSMVAVSLVILTGWGGHISLGQFAIAGMGGLLAGNVLQRGDIDYFVVLTGAGLVGALTALVVGLPALRIRGLFLAVSTLAFAVALNSYVLNRDNFSSIIPGDVTRPVLWERWDLERGYPMYALCLALLLLSVLAARSVRGTRAGRVIIATRDNERAADSASVPTTRIKLAAFLVAGTIAGIAGALHVTILHGLNQGTYSPEMSLEVFSTAVIGGLSSVSGAIGGVLLFQWLGSITALGEIRQLISGAGLLIVLLVFPGGLAQLAANVRDRFLRRIAERHDILVPSLVADKRVDEEDEGEDENLLRGALGGEDDEPTTTAHDELVGSAR